VRRSLRAVRKKGPSAYGGCRTRWRCAPRAAHLTLQRGRAVSASTLRRWLHARGWVGKRAPVGARDDDPQRSEKLARLRPVRPTLGKRAVGRVADALDLPRLPTVGYPWLPQGETGKRVTPGQNQKPSLAGALEPTTGRSVPCTSPRKTTGRFRAVRDGLEGLYPKAQVASVSVGVDHSGIPKAQAVEPGLAAHPRFAVRFLPPYCPKAKPLERACGDGPDTCTRNPQRHRREDLVWDVEQHFSTKGPWKYQLSQLYYTPQVTAAGERITKEQQLQEAA
jgi:hypothetical protein